MLLTAAAATVNPRHMTLEDSYRAAEQYLSTENTGLHQREAVWGQRWERTPCEWGAEESSWEAQAPYSWL